MVSIIIFSICRIITSLTFIYFRCFFRFIVLNSWISRLFRKQLVFILFFQVAMIMIQFIKICFIKLTIIFSVLITFLSSITLFTKYYKFQIPKKGAQLCNNYFTGYFTSFLDTRVQESGSVRARSRKSFKIFGKKLKVNDITADD